MMALLRKHIRAIRFAFIVAAVAVGVVACGGGGGGSSRSSGDGGMQITPAPGGDNPDTTPTPPTLSIGGSRNANLAQAVDVWLVNLISGMTYQFDMESGVFDAFLGIFNNDSTPRRLAVNDDGGVGTNSRVVYRATYTGVHLLGVTGYEDGARGAYRLSARTVTANTPPPGPDTRPPPVTPPPVQVAPDLVVVDVNSANEDDAIGPALTGGRVSLVAGVLNRGTGLAGATRLRYYRSIDSTISAADTLLGTASVPALSAGRIAGFSIQDIGDIRHLPTPGVYYFGACVDRVSGESNTGNNCSDAVRVRVNSPGGGGTPPQSGAGQIAFTLTDRCARPGVIQARFFGYSSLVPGNPPLVWPSSGAYTINNRTTVGGVISATLDGSARAIDRICYGAQLGNGSRVLRGWGAGLDGRQRCSNCCIRVTSSGITRVSRNLTC